VRLADLRFETDDSILYVRLRGDVDLSNAAELRDELRASTPNDAIGLILDLSEVDYLDSAGIHLVHRLREDLRARGQTLRLVIPPDSPVNDALRLAGLDWNDELTDTAEAARLSLQARKPA
jgi:anti-sigma B factor antagonist